MMLFVTVNKRPQFGLEPGNFTFARQPIYHPPDEIVRHAIQRGALTSDSFVAAVEEDKPIVDSTTFSNQDMSASNTLAEGRGKAL